MELKTIIGQEILILKTHVNQKYCKYVNLYDDLKNGITSNPEARKIQLKASNKGWIKMNVQYETSSVNYV